MKINVLGFDSNFYGNNSQAICNKSLSTYVNYIILNWTDVHNCKEYLNSCNIIVGSIILVLISMLLGWSSKLDSGKSSLICLLNLAILFNSISNGEYEKITKRSPFGNLYIFWYFWSIYDCIKLLIILRLIPKF